MFLTNNLPVKYYRRIGGKVACEWAMSICLAVIYVLCISVSLCTKRCNRHMSRVKPRRLPAHDSRALHWLWSVKRESFVLLVYVTAVLTYPYSWWIAHNYPASLRKHIWVRLAKQLTTSMRHTQTTHTTIEAVQEHGIKALRCGPNGPQTRTTTKYNNEWDRQVLERTTKRREY